MTARTRASLLMSSALLVAAIVVYWLTRDRGSGDHRSLNARLQCLACKAQFGAQLDVGEPPPFKCEKCGKPAAWRMKICHDCGLIFTPEPEGDPPRQPMIPVCPGCKGQRIGSAPLDPR